MDLFNYSSQLVCLLFEAIAEMKSVCEANKLKNRLTNMEKMLLVNCCFYFLLSKDIVQNGGAY